MKFIYNQTENIISFKKEDIFKLFEVTDEMIINEDELISDFTENFSDLLNDKKEVFYGKYSTVKHVGIENLEQLLVKKTEIIRSEIISKYLLSENLHVLMSNGCSIYAGSKAINQTEESKCKTLLRSASFHNEPQITELINKLVDENLK